MEATASDGAQADRDMINRYDRGAQTIRRKSWSRKTEPLPLLPL